MSCKEGKEVGKDIHGSAQNAALFVDLLLNIFCLNTLILHFPDHMKMWDALQLYVWKVQVYLYGALLKLHSLRGINLNI